jgi:NADPH:quinone reductase-like Zn-dependent oxidoreductase
MRSSNAVESPSPAALQKIAVAAAVILAPIIIKRLTRKHFKAQSSGAIIISGASTGIGRCVHTMLTHLFAYKVFNN